MIFLLYLIFIFFSLGQLGRISFYGQQVNIYLYEPLILIATVILLGNYGTSPIKEAIKKKKFLFLFISFLGVAYFFGINKFTLFENFVGILYWIRLAIYGIYWIYLTRWTTESKKNQNHLQWVFLLFIFITAIVSLIQYFLYPELRNLIYQGWDPHLYRVFGTFFDTSIAAAIYGMIFIVIFLRRNNFLKNRWLYFGLMILYILFSVLSFSRSLYISLIVILVMNGLIKNKLKIAAGLLLIFVVLIILVPKPFGEGVNLIRIFSIQSRLQDYRMAQKLWEKNPILGVGYNRIRYQKVQLNIIEEVSADVTHSGASFHSSFLTVLVAGGVIGLALFILTLFELARNNFISRNLIIFLSIFSLSDNIILHPFVLLLLFTTLTITEVNLLRRSR